jgi:hypothetical protein
MSVIPKKPVSSITDSFGQIYTYNPSLNQWLITGANYSEPVVSESNNGLITPQTVKLLEQISLESSAGIFDGVKLAANPEVYWYLLYPRNDYIRVHVEYDTQIVVELNATKMSRTVLAQSRCVGPKGQKGIVGPAGANGTAAGIEVTYTGTIAANILSINTAVDTPLDTPLSVRISSGGSQLLEGKIEVAGTSPGSVTFVYPTGSKFALDPSSTLTIANGFLIGRLMPAGNAVWPGSITYKVRQYGPTGATGADGNDFIEISENVLTDPSIQANTVIKTIRRGQPSDIHYITGQVSAEMPVSHLRANSDSSFVSTPTTISVAGTTKQDTWVTVEPTTASSLGLMTWQLQAEDFNSSGIPAGVTDTTLDLPTWVPLKVVGYAGWNGFANANAIQDCQEDLFLVLSELTATGSDNTGHGTGTEVPTWANAKSCDGSDLGVFKLINGLKLPYYFALPAGNNGFNYSICGYVDKTSTTTTTPPSNIMSADTPVSGCNDIACSNAVPACYYEFLCDYIAGSGWGSVFTGGTLCAISDPAGTGTWIKKQDLADGVRYHQYVKGSGTCVPTALDVTAHGTNLALVTDCTADSNWKVDGTTAYQVAANPAWTAPYPTAGWISFACDTGSVGNNHDYSTVIKLGSNVDLANFTISFNWSVDNRITGVTVNGVANNATVDTTNETSFTVIANGLLGNIGWQEGDNQVVFSTYDDGDVGGFLLQWGDSTGCVTWPATPAGPTTIPNDCTNCNSWAQVRLCSNNSTINLYKPIGSLSLPYYFIIPAGTAGMSEAQCGYVASDSTVVTSLPSSIISGETAVSGCNDPACNKVESSSSSTHTIESESSESSHSPSSESSQSLSSESLSSESSNHGIGSSGGGSSGSGSIVSTGLGGAPKASRRVIGKNTIWSNNFDIEESSSSSSSDGKDE